MLDMVIPHVYVIVNMRKVTLSEYVFPVYSCDECIPERRI